MTLKNAKIISLTAERFKRLSVVNITPDGNLVQITGKNGNGKTSVLDAIEAVLGGAAHVPGEPISKGHAKGKITITLGDGKTQLIAERRFTEKNKNGYLEVKAADGAVYKKDAQAMLTDLLGAIGFDPLEFMRMKPAAQMELLRSTVKLEVDIDQLDKDRAAYYADRTAVGRQLDAAQAKLDGIIVAPNLPDEAPDVSALVQELTDIGTFNSEVAGIEQAYQAADVNRLNNLDNIDKLKKMLADAEALLKRQDEGIAERQPIPARKDAAKLQEQISQARLIGEEIARRDQHERAQAEVTTFTNERAELTKKIEDIDTQKANALANAKMPIEGLSFEGGVISFNGVPFDQASGAEKLRVSAAIGAALNPKLRVLLCRDGSLLDSDSLKILAEFADTNDMQIFLERVEESGEVGIVMEDGHVKGQEQLVADLEKSEAEPETPAKAAKETLAKEAEPTPPPTEEETKKAREKLDALIVTIADIVVMEELNQQDIRVKRIWIRFPEMISTVWNPAYLERQKAIGKMKTTRKDK